MFICAIDNNILNSGAFFFEGIPRKIENARDLTRDKYFLGSDPNQKKTDKNAVHVSLSTLGILFLNEPTTFF